MWRRMDGTELFHMLVEHVASNQQRGARNAYLIRDEWLRSICQAIIGVGG
jgi:hypothetical protein